MQDFINLEPWWRFGAALLIGALIGIEREFVQQRADSTSFAGIRTFALISLFGALAAFAADLHGFEIFLVSYGGFILMVAGNRIASVWQGLTTGMTTEVVAVLTPVLGALVIWDRADVAAALGVITALMLAMKPRLHMIARRMSGEDLRATLQFGLISLVVLPLLPDQEFGPFAVLNPVEIWLLVILVSGISFVGYLLMKILGPRQGTGLAGVFGGLVSSTATTVSFASHSRESPDLSSLAGIAVVLASTVMFPRIFIEVLVVYPPLLRLLALPLLVMLVTGALAARYYWRRSAQAESEEIRDVVDLSNPLRLQTALLFAAMFAVVLLVVEYANSAFGSAGLFAVSALSGLTGVDSITLSVSGLTSVGQLDLANAAIAILIAAIINTGFKLGLVHFMGTERLRSVVWKSFALVIAVGAVSGWLAVQYLG